MTKLTLGEWYLTPTTYVFCWATAPTGTGTIALDPTFGSFTLLGSLSHQVNQFLW
jgi:hypothetical protein